MTAPQPWPALMRETTAAKYLDCSKSWLRKIRLEDRHRVRAGEDPQGPPILYRGRTVLYVKQELDGWIETLTQRPGARGTQDILVGVSQTSQGNGSAEVIS